MAMSNTIRVCVPEDAQAGCTLTINIGGQDLELVLPEGCKSGDVIELEVGGGGNSASVEQDNSASVEQDNSPETFEKVDLGDDGKTLKLVSEVSCGGDGTAGFIWAAGRRLAELLSVDPEFRTRIEGKEVYCASFSSK